MISNQIPEVPRDKYYGQNINWHEVMHCRNQLFGLARLATEIHGDCAQQVKCVWHYATKKREGITLSIWKRRICQSPQED